MLRAPERSYLNDLRRAWLFADCSDRTLREVASLCTRLDVPAGRVLTHEGSLGSECFVILEGSAAVERDGRDIGHVHADAVVGAAALIEGRRHTQTVVAAGDMRLLVMNRREFSALRSGGAGRAIQHRLDVIANDGPSAAQMPRRDRP